MGSNYATAIQARWVTIDAHRARLCPLATLTLSHNTKLEMELSSVIVWTMERLKCVIKLSKRKQFDQIITLKLNSTNLADQVLIGKMFGKKHWKFFKIGIFCFKKDHCSCNELVKQANMAFLVRNDQFSRNNCWKMVKISAFWLKNSRLSCNELLKTIRYRCKEFNSNFRT